MSFILFSLGLIFVLYFLVSWSKVYNSKDSLEFVYQWASFIGAFVWEDLLVFSLLHLIFVIITWISHDLRVGLLLIGIFWSVRSSGEALYFFLQQFHRPKHHPHNLEGHLKSFKPFLGEISQQKGYILMQITHQSVVVISISLTILLLKYWDYLPGWF
ncbi:MAG: hypothetical protein OEX81_01265 [Candidatus Pacebacteria bacterium]|nr:hypothetical protein [Candidatus Paceibacterota bacterium]